MKKIMLLITLLLSLTSSYAQEATDSFYYYNIYILDTNYVPTTIPIEDGLVEVRFKQDSLTALASQYKFKVFEHKYKEYPDISQLSFSMQKTYFLSVNDSVFVHQLAESNSSIYFVSTYHGRTDPRKKKALYNPNDQSTTPSGTYLDLINAPAAWDITKGDTSVHIGVTDVVRWEQKCSIEQSGVGRSKHDRDQKIQDFVSSPDNECRNLQRAVIASTTK